MYPCSLHATFGCGEFAAMMRSPAARTCVRTASWRLSFSRSLSVGPAYRRSSNRVQRPGIPCSQSTIAVPRRCPVVSCSPIRQCRISRGVIHHVHQAPRALVLQTRLETSIQLHQSPKCSRRALRFRCASVSACGSTTPPLASSVAMFFSHSAILIAKVLRCQR